VAGIGGNLTLASFVYISVLDEFVQYEPDYVRRFWYVFRYRDQGQTTKYLPKA